MKFISGRHFNPPVAAKRIISLVIGLTLAAMFLIPSPLVAEETTDPGQKGLEALRKGDHDLALGYLNEAIRLNPNDSKAYRNRGFIYNAKKQFDKAIADLTESIRLDPKDALAYGTRARSYGSKGEGDKAIADYTEQIRLAPSPDAYYNRALAYEKKGEYDRAIEDWTEVIRANPKDAEGYSGRALAYNKRKEYDKAIVDFTEAIRLKPDYFLAYYNRGLSYDGKGEFEKALPDYEKAKQLDPNDADARFHAYANQVYVDTMKEIAKHSETIRLNPKDAEAYHARALQYLSLRKKDEAIADWSEAIRSNPSFTKAYLARGIIHEEQGRHEKAIADLREAIRVGPEESPAYTHLAWILGTCAQANFRNGKEAVTYATKACELMEWKDPDVLEILAAACAETGDFEQAIKWETKCLEGPDTSSALRKVARTRLALYQARRPYHQEK